MNTIDLLSPYATKAIEYAIAIGYLALFVPFWIFVNGRTRPAHALRFGWFHAPEDVHLHAGHAWARTQGGTVTVGLDDFAHRLIGPLDGIRLPEIGAPVRQGHKAFTLIAHGNSLDVLSPVDGHVVAVNEAARAHAAGTARDPYGEGWLVKVEPRWLTANLKNLFTAESAREFLDAAAERLAGRMTPELGLVLQDGGTPVHGIARELDPENWPALVRTTLQAQ